MALKGDRYEAKTDITFICDTVLERGGIATLVTGGSGAALDQSAANVTYTAIGSGAKPVGLMLNDVVNVDLSRAHLNWHKNETQKGTKCTLLTDGWVVTNMIYPGATPAALDLALCGPSGLLVPVAQSNTDLNAVAGGLQKVGRFLSIKDEDGYAKVAINLPQCN